VPNLVLSPSEQAALCALLAAEPVPGSALPERRVLELLERLIPCDAICGRRYADDGHLMESVDLRHHPDEPYTLHVEFRNGDEVIDFGLDRTRRPFDGRDVALLAMLTPLLRRLVRERPAPHVAGSLTVQERRVLALVAAGLSNAAIADRLTVAPSTVRKHLEHAYRKLGVSSRMGAIAVMQGCADPGLDLVGRLERFA
jgi:DNA-binding CsgD family transcriptional regulator